MFSLSKLLKGIEEALLNVIAGLEEMLDYNLGKLRKNAIKIVVQAALFTVSLVTISAGIALFFSRFFPLDLVLLFGGFILLYLIWLWNILQR